MKRGGGLSRRTPLKVRTPLVRKAPLTASSAVGSRGLAKGAPKGLKRVRLAAARPKPAVPPARRKTLADRSGGVCEIGLPGCVGTAHYAHHRISQKAGGRRGAARERHDRLSNLLHACWLCHDIVTNPPGSLRVYGLGLCLREWQVPSQVPVLYRGEVVYLADDGQVAPFEAVGV